MVRIILLFISFLLLAQFESAEVAKAREELKQGLFIDARDRLVNYLKENPNSLEALVLLMEYYSVYASDPDEVLKYVQVAEDALPRANFLERVIFSESITYYKYNALSQKNKYKEAYETLKSLENRGYLPTWYYSSLSWILFKLGRMEEALKAAKDGLKLQADHLSSLNMVGILYGVIGKWDESIKAFNRAIEIGKLIGESVSAPINNLGEVYEELFNETKAIQLYEEAMRSESDCSALLSYVNLGLLYLDFLDTRSAARVIREYRRCVARFPFRSPKAFRSLLNLVDARIKYLEGDFKEARRLARWILDYDQQLGLVGTDQNDLKVAALQTLILANQALYRAENLKATTFTEKLLSQINSVRLKLENWLYGRELHHLLVFKLNRFEDLRIRNTDAFLFYPFLGFELAKWPKKRTLEMIESQSAKDSRPRAVLYYDLYKASISPRENIQRLKENSLKLRAYYDEALAVGIYSLILQHENNVIDRIRFSNLLFDKWPQAFVVFDLKLPVKVRGVKLPRRLPFEELNHVPARFELVAEFEDNEYKVSFFDTKGRTIIVRDASLKPALRMLALKVFNLL
ncbi:MAG: tetratricopeptide repeat protein [Thermoplasmatales archaeon]